MQSHISSDGPLYLDVRPFVRLVADAFGPERLVWSSGTPQIVDAHLEHVSEGERNKVKGDNLVALLKFEPFTDTDKSNDR